MKFFAYKFERKLYRSLIGAQKLSYTHCWRRSNVWIRAIATRIRLESVDESSIAFTVLSNLYFLGCPASSSTEDGCVVLNKNARNTIVDHGTTYPCDILVLASTTCECLLRVRKKCFGKLLWPRPHRARSIHEVLYCFAKL